MRAPAAAAAQEGVSAPPIGLEVPNEPKRSGGAPLRIDNLFTLLALELPLSATALRQKVEADPGGADEVADLFENSPLAALDLTLAEPIEDPTNGTPLIAQGGSLSARKLRALLSRHGQARELLDGPVVLALAGPVVAYCRERILKFLAESNPQAGGDSHSGTSDLHRVVERSGEFKHLAEDLERAQQALLDAPGGVATLFPLLGNPSGQVLVRQGMLTALVSMALLSELQRTEGAAGGEQARFEVGVAALIQDLSLALHPEARRADHQARSAKLAERMGFQGRVVACVAHHHHFGDLPPPVAAGEHAVCVRALVTANAFVQKTSERRGHLFESIKVLNHLADHMLLDRTVVQVLGKIFLPRLHSQVLTQANELGTRCANSANRPTLWPVAGDKMPTVFLCQADACDHQSKQVSRLATEVNFQVGGKVVAKMEKGDYFTCPFLSRKLREFYTLIQGKILRDAPDPTVPPPGTP